MNAKELKKYSLISEIGNSDVGDSKLPALFKELGAIDFVVASEMWEYMLTTHVARLFDIGVSSNIEGEIFATLLKISEVKTKTLFTENPTLLKLIYGSASTSAMGENLDFVTGLILGSKIDAADQILTFVAGNKHANMDFGDRLKAIIDNVFETYCKKTGARVPQLNRKQTMLLLEHALKVKGPNKALLSQRIKELQ